MMTRKHYNDRDEFDKPEMLQSPLDKLVLQVKHVGTITLMFYFSLSIHFNVEFAVDYCTPEIDISLVNVSSCYTCWYMYVHNIDTLDYM